LTFLHNYFKGPTRVFLDLAKFLDISAKLCFPCNYYLTYVLQNHIYEWVRDHRVHHKFTDTNADPHNAKRGFFFSHMGWLLVRKHPDVISKGVTVDMSDLEKDPVVVWQRRYDNLSSKK